MKEKIYKKERVDEKERKYMRSEREKERKREIETYIACFALSLYTFSHIFSLRERQKKVFARKKTNKADKRHQSPTETTLGFAKPPRGGGSA